MAETTADVRRDIELTRERMSDTIAQLEHKLNVMEMVREHPWPAVALAAGLGMLLAGSKADVKAAAATVKATGGASDKMGGLLDDAASRLITGVSAALSTRVDEWVDELKDAIVRLRPEASPASAVSRRVPRSHPLARASAGTAPPPMGPMARRGEEAIPTSPLPEGASRTRKNPQRIGSGSGGRALASARPPLPSSSWSSGRASSNAPLLATPVACRT